MPAIQCEEMVGGRMVRWKDEKEGGMIKREGGSKEVGMVRGIQR
jgi:hypothetical protein